MSADYGRRNLPDSIFTDDRDYVISRVTPNGERGRRIEFTWKDGRRGSILMDASMDTDEARDKVIRAYFQAPRQYGH